MAASCDWRWFQYVADRVLHDSVKLHGKKFCVLLRKILRRNELHNNALYFGKTENPELTSEVRACEIRNTLYNYSAKTR